MALRIGLIGVGRGRMVQLLGRRRDVRFAAVCDPVLRSRELRERVLAEMGAAGASFAAAYADFDRFLCHEMDLVVIASPAPVHAVQSVAVLRSGRDVVCEVPAVMSLGEAEELVAAVRETGRRYFFAENCCYWGFVRAWTAILRSGRLGRPYYAEGDYIHDVRSLMRDDSGEPTWRASLNPVRYCTHETGPLFDMLDCRGTTVRALATPSWVAPEFPAPDAGAALLTTSSGAVVRLLACFKNAMEPAYHRYLVFGTGGTLETRTTETLTLATFEDIPHLQGRVSLPLGTALRGQGSGGGHGGADAAMLNDFVDAAIADRPSPIDVYRGLDYSLPGVCAAMSCENGGIPVDIPDPRHFPARARGNKSGTEEPPCTSAECPPGRGRSSG
ncbi:MAG: Gfo/Idh/MocA family oxidoreductase [Lentisphaeria bacterium]|nr:Gfo/Idh/MocA family oxidoreductase [Lentisphaeria bacterium]